MSTSSRPDNSRRLAPVIGLQTAFAVGACGGPRTILISNPAGRRGEIE